MTNDYLVECGFLIPIRRDKRLSDGEPHATTAWDWLGNELWEKVRIERYSLALEYARWPDKTGQAVHDLSRVYTIAVRDEMIDELRKLLMQACLVFYQECIYFRVGSRVEFVYPPP